MTVRDDIRKRTADDSEYRFAKGVTHLRVLPAVNDGAFTKEGDFFRQSFEHWMGNGYLACPRPSGACPVCEEGERLYNLGGEDNIAAANELRPKQQFYFNAVIFSSPDGKTPKDGPVTVRAGIKVVRQLIDLDEDHAGGWGNMTDFDAGFDVRVERLGSGRNDTEYNVKPVQAKVTGTLKEALEKHGVSVGSLAGKVSSLSTVVDELSYEDIKRKFDHKQIVPGFPGGPRRLVEDIQPKRTPAPPTVGANVTFEGEVPPPPPSVE